MASSVAYEMMSQIMSFPSASVMGADTIALATLRKGNTDGITSNERHGQDGTKRHNSRRERASEQIKRLIQVSIGRKRRSGHQEARVPKAKHGRPESYLKEGKKRQRRARSRP